MLHLAYAEYRSYPGVFLSVVDAFDMAMYLDLRCFLVQSPVGNLVAKANHMLIMAARILHLLVKNIFRASLFLLRHNVHTM